MELSSCLTLTIGVQVLCISAELVRGDNGQVLKIIEYKDGNAGEIEIKEVNPASMLLIKNGFGKISIN